MKWQLDNNTWEACVAHPARLKAEEPANQFPGRNFNTCNWTSKLPPDHLLPLAGCISSPENIISRFSTGQYLEGLALVVSWGTMWRTNRRIYNPRLESIRTTLEFCANEIRETESVRSSWNRVTGKFNNGLSWSSVMASKVLHFLARSQGFTNEPPVPIDNLVIRQEIWPRWLRKIENNQEILPSNWPLSWGGDSWEAYERYMTFILYNARNREWTTTDWETTLFAQVINQIE